MMFIMAFPLMTISTTILKIAEFLRIADFAQ